MRRLAVVFGAMGIALLGWGCRGGTERPETPKTDFYTVKVQPIFRANCYRCHGGMNHRGGLSLATRAGILKGGKHGPAVVPGDPAKSLLVQLIRHEQTADLKPMPPKSPKISDADIAVVEQWIKAGAIIPKDAAQH
jgi:cytochrome c